MNRRSRHRRIKHARAERGLDLYSTAPEAVRALMRVERLPLKVCEPACGRGAIVDVLRLAGHVVGASDVRDYGVARARTLDFLKMRRAPDGFDLCLTNPPYFLATEFVAHALELFPRVVMLLRLTFLESERRKAILEDGRLARVYVFENRLPMMHRDGWRGKKSTSDVCYAWFVWRASRGPAPTLHRLRWEA